MSTVIDLRMPRVPFQTTSAAAIFLPLRGEALVQELRRGRVQVPASSTQAKAAGKQRNIRLVAIVKPQIDVQKLGRILLAVADHETTKSKSDA